LEFFYWSKFNFFSNAFLGVAGMPRRIPDYPDAYFIFNKIASWGSYISAVSSLFFFYIVFEAFSFGKSESTKVVDSPKPSLEKNIMYSSYTHD